LQHRPIKDGPARAAIEKFDNSLDENYAEALEHLKEEDLRKMEELDELFDFLDDMIPLTDKPSRESSEDVKPKRGRKRRSESVVSTTTNATSSTTTTARGRGRPRGSK
jgi:condensin complex subunit 3